MPEWVSVLLVLDPTCSNEEGNSLPSHIAMEYVAAILYHDDETEIKLSTGYNLFIRDAASREKFRGVASAHAV